MPLALLPVAIFHREFDSKLLVAFELASKYKIPSLFGYDKYFNQVIPFLGSSVLLEKSCSTIAWNGRIKTVKNRDGSVLVSDEEGFNNLTPYNKLMFNQRVNKVAAEHIDSYGCWGKLDYDFFITIPELSRKVEILGNPRSDLLGPLGAAFYKHEVQALNHIFGRFALATDNFRVEPRQVGYKVPVFSDDEEVAKELEQKERYLVNARERRRKFFSNLLEKNATALPSTQFILRPHPTSDTTWWSERFSTLRNLHVIYHKNVEPWILSSSCLISMGCTTAVQAAISNTPVIEVEEPDIEPYPDRGLAHLFANYTVKSSGELNSLTSQLYNSSKHINNSNTAILTDHWFGSDKAVTYKRFAEKLYSLLPQNANDGLNLETLNKAHRFYKKNNIYINDNKWPLALDFQEITKKVLRLNHILNPSTQVKIQEVSNNLFLIAPK